MKKRKTKKYLILGGESRLAQCFFKLYEKECWRLNKKECDITSLESVQKNIEKYPCRYVLNCAAITDIEKCEKDTELCFKVNVCGVFNLNKACWRLGKKLIHISSDYAINPVNNYGWSKYLSEKTIHKRFLMIRTNFYDRNNFIAKNILKGNKIEVYKDKFFNPISINGLAEKIYLNSKKAGILNIFTSNKLSYVKFANLFCEIFGLNKKLIRPVKYKNKINIKRPTNSYVPSDFRIKIREDLINFKKYLYENR